MIVTNTGRECVMADIVDGCLCGNVRYRVDAEPVMTAVCHCAHCQKQTGTSFSILVAVPAGNLHSWADRRIGRVDDLRMPVATCEG